MRVTLEASQFQLGDKLALKAGPASSSTASADEVMSRPTGQH